MGYSELIGELNREAGERIEERWRLAREEVEQLKLDAAGELERLRREHEDRQTRTEEEEARTILAEGERKILAMKLEAMDQLSGRLLRTARSLLAEMRAEEEDGLFEALAGELPDFPWETVKVNPRDRDAAHRRFPKARVVCDDAIGGGMEVSDGDGAIRIVNTLEKRLERIWPELLSELIADALEEIDRDAAAAKR